MTEDPTPSDFDFDCFIHDAMGRFISHQSNQRYGQFLMNRLHGYYPEVYYQIPPEADCFYDNSKVPTLLSFLASL